MQMMKKGTSGALFHSYTRHQQYHRLSSAAPDSPVDTIPAAMMEEELSDAEKIITKWDPQVSSCAKITSLFHDSREEARLFLRAVADLKRVVEDSHVSTSALLVRAQTLMQAAMRRLQKEFHQILSANRFRLDPEPVSACERSSLSGLEEGEMRSTTESIGDVEGFSAVAMADLRSIADCMISSGHGKECIKIYKLVRCCVVDEGLDKLGYEKLSQAHIQKLNWDVFDVRIRSWLGASKVAVRTLFSGERALCDQVFASSDSVRESCFAEVCMEPAMQFFGFPELVASKKISPEKIFRILDMHDSMSELLPEVESVFSHPSASPILSQAVSSLFKLGEAVRSMLADFVSAIQMDNSKAAVPGGGLHPLSRYVMNYVAFLADYSSSLEDIFADYPVEMPSSVPESVFDVPKSISAPLSPSSLDGENPLMSQVFVRISWLILVLLCKLYRTATLYHEVALAYLFQANNLQYVVNKVRGCKLLEVLGDDWVARHEAKARGYLASYERLAWNNVLACIPHDSAAIEELDKEAAVERIRRFNEAFEEAYRGQVGWAVSDGRMREELKLSVARKVVPAYRPFYERCRLLLQRERESPSVLVRFTPEDLETYLSGLFCAGAGAGSSSSASSVSGPVAAVCGSSHGSRGST